MLDGMPEGGQENPMMALLMALLGGQEEQKSEPMIVDEMEGSPMVDLTGDQEEEVAMDGDILTQLTQLFAQ